MYGKPGKPNREYAGGYGLAHIDAKHPEAADQIQRFLDVAEADDARLSKTNTDSDRVVLTDGVYFLAMTKVWRGEPKHSKSTWIITVYEKGRPQNQVATSAVSRGRSPWMPQPAAAKDSTPDWEKALSKFKGTPFSRLRGQLLPRITVDRPVEERRPLDAPPRIRACLPFHGDGRCSRACQARRTLTAKAAACSARTAFKALRPNSIQPLAEPCYSHPAFILSRCAARNAAVD